MAKLKITMTAPTNEDGTINEEQIAPRQASGNSGVSYAPLPKGFYRAHLTKLEEKSYRARYGDYKSPAPADWDEKKQGKWDGKWDYIGVIPHFEVPHMSTVKVPVVQVIDGEEITVEEERDVLDYVTSLNRQDYTVGVVHNGTLFRVPQDGKSPIFRSDTGAYDLLRTLGLFRLVGNEVELDYDPDIIRNRVCFIGTRLGAYAKRKDDTTLNWSPDEFDDFMKSEFGSENLPLEDLFELIEAYNEAHADEWGTVADGYGIRVKTVITWFGALKPEDVERHGYYLDEETHQVFVSEDDYVTYKGFLALEDTAEDAEFQSL